MAFLQRQLFASAVASQLVWREGLIRDPAAATETALHRRTLSRPIPLPLEWGRATPAYKHRGAKETVQLVLCKSIRKRRRQTETALRHGQHRY